MRSLADAQRAAVAPDPSSAAERRTYRTILILLAAGAAIALLYLRAPGQFSNPQFWAEDGAIFWLGAYQHGISAIWQPYGGYLHLAPRLVALIASWLPPAVAPAIYVYATVLLTGWCAATAAGAPRNALLGLCFAAALLLAPVASGEIWATPANIQWIMAPVMALVLLSPPPESGLGRVNQCVFVTVAALSGPFSIFALPLAGWRLWTGRDALGLIVLAAAAIQAFMLMTTPLQTLDPTITNHLHLALTLALLTFGGYAGLVASGILIAIAIILPKDRDVRVGMLVSAGALLAATYWRHIPISDAFDRPGWGARYFYVPHVALMWCALSVAFAWPVGRIVAPVWFIVFGAAAYGVGSFKQVKFPDLKWREHAREIGSRDVAIPIPPNWTLHVPAR